MPTPARTEDIAVAMADWRFHPHAIVAALEAGLDTRLGGEG
jgi:hypothetical protein